MHSLPVSCALGFSSLRTVHRRSEFSQILSDLDKRIEDEETPPGLPEGGIEAALKPQEFEDINEDEFEEVMRFALWDRVCRVLS